MKDVLPVHDLPARERAISRRIVQLSLTNVEIEPEAASLNLAHIESLTAAKTNRREC